MKKPGSCESQREHDVKPWLINHTKPERSSRTMPFRVWVSV